MNGRESLQSDAPLGTLATVIVDRDSLGPTLREPGEDGREIEHAVASDIWIVSTYALHVALYALQNPTPENIEKALYRLGTSGDLEEATDRDTLLPLPVSVPSGWNWPKADDG